MARRGMNRLFEPYPMVSPGSAEKLRDRTPSEIIAAGYMGVAQVASLGAVTQLSMESLRECDAKRREILAERPDLEAPLTGLLFNHARLLAEIQNSVTNNDRRA